MGLVRRPFFVDALPLLLLRSATSFLECAPLNPPGWVFAFAAFAGAFLLFFVEPLAAKDLLPRVGGGFMVWAIALAFFQTALLAGYLIVHFIFGKNVSLKRTLVYLCATAAFTVFGSKGSAGLSAPPEGSYALWETTSLALMVGLPFLALSTGQLTLQRWWTSGSRWAFSTNFIFTASNIGSLAGLLAFPLFCEPRWASTQLWYAWKWGTIGWLISMAVCSFWSRHQAVEEFGLKDCLLRLSASETDEFTFMDWVLPAMAGSALLSATTNVLTMDVAAFPLLWVVPLAIYLLTWIRTFAEGAPISNNWFEYFAEILSAAFILTLINQLGFTLDATIKFISFLAGLFSICLVCHGALRMRKPSDESRLTGYFLAMTVGGAAGTALVAFVCPRLFNGLGEYPLSLFLAAWAVWGENPVRPNGNDRFFPIRLFGILLLVFGLPAAFNKGMPETGSFLVTATAGAIFYLTHSLREASRMSRNRVPSAAMIALCLIGLETFGTNGTVKQVFRNFYGLYKVFDNDNVRFLQMGSTYHGHESLVESGRGKPLYYYHAATPIGAFMSREHHTWRKIAVVGLGAGTLAAFSRHGEAMDFYELDPDGVDIARKWFSYLGSASAEIKVITGDGRLSLRVAASASYDLILLDAFSSDAIPVHLLTLEAISEYMKALRGDGLLLFHISNRHLDLRPLLVAEAGRLGFEARLAANPDPTDSMVYPTRWVAIGSSAGISRHLDGLEGWSPQRTDSPIIEPWTDQFSSLWSVWFPGQN